MDSRNQNLNSDIGAIILAAGLGRRLTSVGPKPFLFYDGKSFLEIAVENTSAIACHPVIIVTNETLYQRIFAVNFPAKILINPHPDQGMLSSLLIGLKEIPAHCSGFFLCPIDYPLVQPETYRTLLAAHQSFPDCIIIPAFEGLSGHPIVIPQNIFKPLSMAQRDESVRMVIRHYPHLTKTITVADPGILININTPQLYHQYCK